MNNINIKANESEKKLTGSYYTPDWIANFVARWIDKYHVNAVLEPSCGDGIFFNEIIKESPDNKTSLIGFDTDSSALDLCRKRQILLNANLSLYNQDY